MTFWSWAGKGKEGGNYFNCIAYEISIRTLPDFQGVGILPRISGHLIGWRWRDRTTFRTCRDMERECPLVLKPHACLGLGAPGRRKEGIASKTPAIEESWIVTVWSPAVALAATPSQWPGLLAYAAWRHFA